MSELIEHWIDGGAVRGAEGQTSPVYDPASGEVTRQVRTGSAADVDKAVQSGLRGFDSWAALSLGRRTDVLFGFRELVLQHGDDLAAAITSEHGKTLDDARGEVQRGQEVVEFACGIAHALKGEFSLNVSTSIDAHSLRQPLGVVGGVTPFNFPVMVPMWMHPIAIACGNSFVLKPSEKDPTPSMMTAELWKKAGLPDGVFNVVNGGSSAVNAMLEHSDVAAVSFVGSTPVARHVYSTAASGGKRVQALGGAKNHMVVLPDADLEAAADAAVSGGYGSAGERCMAISVVVAVGGVADDLVDAIASRARALRVGPGTENGVDMGPLVTAAHRDHVAGYIGSGVEAGAKLVVDGRDISVEHRAHGFWLGPTLFDHVETHMAIYSEEIFGPVLSVVRVDSLHSAIEIVNRNVYGNGTAIFTNSGAAARSFTTTIQAGMVGVNIPIPVPMAYYSFGGWGESLFGDAKMHGEEGVRFYTQGKTVATRWGDTAGVDLVMPTAH